MSTVVDDSAALMDFSETMRLPDGLLPGQAGDGDAEAESRHAVSIGNIRLLLPRDEVSELVERARICRLPNTSTWFSGITSVRGSMIPVFDLHELFDIAVGTGPRRLIVVGEHEKAVAFWVDDFPRVVSFGEDDRVAAAPPLPSLINDYSSEFFSKDDQTWVDWDIEGFVTTLGEMI